MKKTEIAMFDEWMAMRERLDKEKIIDGPEPEGKEEDLVEEEESFTLRKHHWIDAPHPVCVTSFLSHHFR